MNYNKMDDLQKYFFSFNEGLGTLYERYSLGIYLETLIKRYNIKSVLEMPANGTLGIPGLKSLIFAKHDCDVTLINEFQSVIDAARKVWDFIGLKANFKVASYAYTGLRSNSYDLVWNFCSFEHFKEPDRTVSEMCRLSKKIILISIQNRLNPGVQSHRLYHFKAYRLIHCDSPWV